MTEWISKHIIAFLKAKNAIQQDEDVCLYGCDAVIYTLLSTLGLLLISLLCGMLSGGLLCVAIFYLNQSIGGGYHANTHLKCFFTMSLGLLFSFGIIHTIKNEYILAIACIPALLILFLLPLVLHPLLHHLEIRRKKLERRSYIFSVIESTLCLLCLIFAPPTISVFINIAIILSAISRVTGYYIYRNSNE